MASALSGCVTSLQSSIALLDSSISILDSGVNDFPRLSKTLESTRHFELLPESTLQTAQAALVATIAPEIQALLGRVETHLDRLARREQALIAKSELLAGRLGEGTAAPESSMSTASAATRIGGSRSVSTLASESGLAAGVELDREALRMKQLRQKKERLSFAVERLTLQATQKERQLRMSMAAPPEED